MAIKKSGSKCHWCGYMWHIFGVIFIAFGLSLLIFFPDFFHNHLLKNLELTSQSRTYSEWKAPTVPLYMDIYIWNWTNPDDIKNSSTKPTFEQLGPYRFREFPDKLNISFDDSNYTVSYRKFSTYFFDPDGSNGSLSDMWTSVNMVAVGAGNRVQNWSYFPQVGVSLTLIGNSHKVHVTKTVEELLFDGYEDSLVTMATFFSNETPYDRVGMMVKKNATDELSGNYAVNTGVEDIFKLGQIETFNNLTEFPFYEGECKKLKGSAGEFFSPQPSTTEPIYLFTPEMCRSIPYSYELDINLHDIKGNRFTAGARALDNGTLYDDNKCYATDELMPSGVMNISICNYNHPTFMSFPHFYGADKYYLEGVQGLSPDKEKHQSYITLEPTTGITLEVTARFQTNILMKQYGDYISLYKDVPRFFLPVFWIEQRFVLDAEKASELKMALMFPAIGRYVGIFLVISGIILMSISPMRRLLGIGKRQCETPYDIYSRIEANEPVIKEQEIDPLMSITEITKQCCK